MLRPRDYRTSARDREGKEQEPLCVTDQRGIVIVWPDHHVHRFSWSALRQLSIREEMADGGAGASGGGPPTH
ncbi:MAG TPA: hypothetical protein VNN62_04725 [Methylomirabilota bacterium]|jgi:hypothetical protein|nr:hypothetical protein [Methylomirabilota bacterium]